MSYFTRITKNEVCLIKEKVNNTRKQDQKTKRQKEVPLTPPEERLTTSLETVRIDDDIQQGVNSMTGEEILRMMNKVLD
jgi:hypothetical protein